MAYRKKTLRSMSPITRKLARLIGELDSVERRLRNLVPEIQRIEGESQALWKQRRSELQRAEAAYKRDDAAGLFEEAKE